MTPDIHRPQSSDGFSLSSRIDMHAAIEEWLRSAGTQVPPVDLSATPLGLRAWAGHFADRGTVMLELRRGAVLEALVPMATRARRIGGVELRHWSSPGNFCWQFGYPLVGENVERAMLAALELLCRRSDWDVLEFGPMLGTSAHARALHVAGVQLGMRLEEVGRKHDPVVFVSGTWDDYYARLGGNLREMIRRGERRLAREGQVSFLEYGGGPDLERHLREFLELEAAGWKGRKGTAIACDPQVQAFYVDLAREAAGQGQFRLYELRVGEQLVASDYCIRCGDVVHMLKIAYDETRARCSPGQVIRKLVLQRLFEQGEVAIYDLMAGGGDHAAYKRDWANGGREYIVLRVFNPATVRGRLARALAAVRRLQGRLYLRTSRP